MRSSQESALSSDLRWELKAEFSSEDEENILVQEQYKHDELNKGDYDANLNYIFKQCGLKNENEAEVDKKEEDESDDKEDKANIEGVIDEDQAEETVLESEKVQEIEANDMAPIEEKELEEIDESDH